MLQHDVNKLHHSFCLCLAPDAADIQSRVVMLHHHVKNYTIYSAFYSKICSVMLHCIYIECFIYLK